MDTLAKFRINNMNSPECMVVYDILENIAYTIESTLGLLTGSVCVWVDTLYKQTIVRMYHKNIEILLLGLHYNHKNKTFILHNIVIALPHRNKGLGKSIFNIILSNKHVKDFEIRDIINSLIYKIINRNFSTYKISHEGDDCLISKEE